MRVPDQRTTSEVASLPTTNASPKTVALEAHYSCWFGDWADEKP
jgi:hypothetical protein